MKRARSTLQRFGCPIIILAELVAIVFALLPYSVEADSPWVAAIIEPETGNPFLATSTNLPRLGAIQQTSLVAADPEALAEFGWAVAVSGNTAVVGARSADPDLGGGQLANAGAAYVFVRSGSTWIQEARLVARDANPGDAFGVSVAVDGDTVVIGATGSEVGEETDAGAAYVFARAGIIWEQTARLVAADAAQEDNFGASVAIDADTIVVGADGKDPGGYLIDAGIAYVFLLRSHSWDQKAELMAADAEVGDYFGGSVAISGDRIVVGATEANFTGPRGTGTAYVFRGGGKSWTQEAQLTAQDGRSGDFFGNAVAIAGNTLAVGALFKDPDLEAGRITNAGAAYIFLWRAGKWRQQATLTAANAAAFDQFGQSVSVTGDKVLVGANGEQNAGYTAAGAAYLFVRNDQEWEQHTRLVADFAYDNDHFGQSVAISGDTAIVGAIGRDPALLSGAGEAFAVRLAQVQLPGTGFAPGRITRLAVQSPSNAYNALGELWLEIPSLNIRTPIVGIRQGGSGWDVSWLWGQAGYLEGTSFPTQDGNSAIVGHVYLPNGKPGPFMDLHRLGWEDQIILHAWGQRYLYAVRQVYQVHPADLTALRPETRPWITLITCRDYEETSGEFQGRLVVRAALVAVGEE